MTQHYRRYAFFDLDGTLILDASVIAFYHYYIEREHPNQAPQLAAQFSTTLANKLRAGVARDAINAWFYQTHFCDLAVSEVDRLARDWLASRCADPQFFKQNVIDLLQSCRAQEIGTVIITGSFREVVAPLVQRFQADAYLCAPLVEQGGCYTGAMHAAPMIGQGKALAIERFLAQHQVDAQDCWGVGDDHTDIPFLAMLGKPMALASGTDALLAHAAKFNWGVIDA